MSPISYVTIHRANGTTERVDLENFYAQRVVVISPEIACGVDRANSCPACGGAPPSQVVRVVS